MTVVKLNPRRVKTRQVMHSSPWPGKEVRGFMSDLTQPEKHVLLGKNFPVEMDCDFLLEDARLQMVIQTDAKHQGRYRIAVHSLDAVMPSRIGGIYELSARSDLGAAAPYCRLVCKDNLSLENATGKLKGFERHGILSRAARRQRQISDIFVEVSKAAGPRHVGKFSSLREMFSPAELAWPATTDMGAAVLKTATDTQTAPQQISPLPSRVVTSPFPGADVIDFYKTLSERDMHQLLGVHRKYQSENIGTLLGKARLYAFAEPYRKISDADWSWNIVLRSLHRLTPTGALVLQRDFENPNDCTVTLERDIPQAEALDILYSFQSTGVAGQFNTDDLAGNLRALREHCETLPETHLYRVMPQTCPLQAFTPPDNLEDSGKLASIFGRVVPSGGKKPRQSLVSRGTRAKRRAQSGLRLIVNNG